MAFYLPQFHPIPENDQWWSEGFTEWTNVAKAKPLYRGHYQPHIPADLGFYDLRVPETRLAQATMARRYGIEAFCYWHYWFGGERLLERPFDEVLKSGQPDFPFCLAWANESWAGRAHGLENRRVLKEQTYPGTLDHLRHFEFLATAFSDSRYLHVDEKPVFLIYKPRHLPDSLSVTNLWRDQAVRLGLRGLHLVAIDQDPNWDPTPHGFDAVTLSTGTPVSWLTWNRPLAKIARRARFSAPFSPILNKVAPRPRHVYPYEDAVKELALEPRGSWPSYPCVLPNWDNTPRNGLHGYVLHGSTPELFRTHLRRAIERVRARSSDRRVIFVKSWNEWAEGNHLEPDIRFGLKYLEVVAEEVGVALSE